MSARAARAAALLTTLAAAGCGATRPELAERAAPHGAAAAFSYIEQTEQGRLRELASGRPMLAAVDVNSRVSLHVDVAGLRTALAEAGVPSPSADALRSLGERVAALSAASAGLVRIVELGDHAVAAWRLGQRSGDYSAFDAQLRALNEATALAVDSLAAAIRRRLVEEGHAPEEAQRLADLAIEPAMTGPGRVYGYDWAMIGLFHRNEIARLEQRIERLPADPGLELSVRAYRVDRDGNEVPIALDRYNAEAAGPRVRYPKLHFDVPEDQLRLYARYDTLAGRIGAARSAGEAFRRAVEAEFAGVRAQLEPTLAAAAAAVGSAATRLRRLEAWADKAALEAWAASLRPRLEAVAGGAAALAVWDSLAASLAGLPDELAALRALAGLRGTLAQTPPDQAMARILAALGGAVTAAGSALDAGRWRERARLARRFAEAVGEIDASALVEPLESGPVGDLRDAAAAIEAAARAIEGSGDAVAAWLQRLSFVPPAASAAALPEPKGQRQLPIAGNLDTSFDLQTVPGGIEENDRIRVYYDVLRAGSPTGIAWNDEFTARVFGWRSRVVAGLAFIHGEGDGAWVPTPSLSWLASFRPWPSDGETGLDPSLRSGIGFGLSTMALDFDPDQAIELGIAGTVSLLGDRILGGYGANLQHGEPRWFGFFSIRLFSTTGQLGVPEGGG